MKLEGVHGSTIYATEGRDVYASDQNCEFEPIGRLPLPQDWDESLVYRALMTRPWQSLVDQAIGTITTTNVWPLNKSTLLASVGRSVFVSHDHGRKWRETLSLPSSSGPMGVLPSAVAHRDGVTYLGEYPLANDATPRVLLSDDDGRTWSEFIALPDVRHIHAIQVDPYTDELWITTGDTDAESRIGRLQHGEFEVVGGGSQRWRAVQLAFTPDAILWGMDCGYADENYIFKLPRDGTTVPSPRPTPVHVMPGSVYYSAGLSVGGHRWVVFSTAMEIGSDSTGPTARNSFDSPGHVVAASSQSNFTDWHLLASYRRSKGLTENLSDWFPRPSGYIFIASVPDRGLFVNPFNTETANGKILRFPPHQLAKFPQQPVFATTPDQ